MSGDRRCEGDAGWDDGWRSIDHLLGLNTNVETFSTRHQYERQKILTVEEADEACCRGTSLICPLFFAGPRTFLFS